MKNWKLMGILSIVVASPHLPVVYASVLSFVYLILTIFHYLAEMEE